MNSVDDCGADDVSGTNGDAADDDDDDDEFIATKGDVGVFDSAVVPRELRSKVNGGF